MATIIFLVAFVSVFSAVRCAEYKCFGKAEYSLSFYGMWSNETHPNAFPPGGHFSPLVGCSHNKDYYLWAPGMMASDGVKYVAEMGKIFSLLPLQRIFEVFSDLLESKEKCRNCKDLKIRRTRFSFRKTAFLKGAKCPTIQMKATEQYIPVLLFIILYTIVLTLESEDEILNCDHSNV